MAIVRLPARKRTSLSPVILANSRLPADMRMNRNVLRGTPMVTCMSRSGPPSSSSEVESEERSRRKPKFLKLLVEAPSYWTESLLSSRARISGVNEKEGWVYFTASPENATQHYLYRARLDGSGEPERVSPAAAAGWHTYDISPDGRWAFHTFSNFDTPDSTDLIRLPAHSAVRSLVDNADLKAKAAPFVAAVPREFFKVDVGEGVTLDGWMLRPAQFDPSKKYPVLVFIYGEAAGQTVLDSWSEEALAFHRTVASQGYIVVSFDNRGTPAPKGREWRKATYGAI